MHTYIHIRHTYVLNGVNARMELNPDLGLAMYIALRRYAARERSRNSSPTQASPLIRLFQAIEMLGERFAEASTCANVRRQM
jgi:hypothetical protein